jgi:hypothetical protein
LTDLVSKLSISGESYNIHNTKNEKTENLKWLSQEQEIRCDAKMIEYIFIEVKLSRTRLSKSVFLIERSSILGIKRVNSKESFHIFLQIKFKEAFYFEWNSHSVLLRSCCLYRMFHQMLYYSIISR